MIRLIALQIFLDQQRQFRLMISDYFLGEVGAIFCVDSVSGLWASEVVLYERHFLLAIVDIVSGYSHILFF